MGARGDSSAQLLAHQIQGLARFGSPFALIVDFQVLLPTFSRLGQRALAVIDPRQIEQGICIGGVRVNSGAVRWSQEIGQLVKVYSTG